MKSNECVWQIALLNVPSNKDSAISNVIQIMKFSQVSFHDLHCWEATVTGGLETGPRFSFKTDESEQGNLKI